MLNFIHFIVTLLLMLSCWLLNPIHPAQAASLPSTVYEQRTIHNPDGIGKYYMGREIAQVMGHTGAGWLERSRRETEEQPVKVITAINLRPSDIIADIGAGTGYFSFRIAPLLTAGKVFAVDIQPRHY